MKLKSPGVDLAWLHPDAPAICLLPSLPFVFLCVASICHLEGLLAGELANKDLLNASMNEPSSLANPGEVPMADVPDGLHFSPACSWAWPETNCWHW